MEGIVKWFNNGRGYGFIRYEDDQEIFVHYTGINKEGYKSLDEGQQVTFDIVEGARGPQATNVTVVDDDSGNSDDYDLDDFYDL